MVVNKNTSISFWRAALGGVLGNLSKAVFLLIIFSLASRHFTPGFLLFAILGVVPSAIMGMVVGLAIRVIIQKVHLGSFGRAGIGAGLLFVLGLLAYISGVNQWSADNYSTWVTASLFYGDFGIITGALAGIMAGSTKRK